MSYSKQDVQRVRQPVRTADKLATGVLDASATVSILTIGSVSEKVTFQASGDLAGTVEFSVNGTNWFGSTAIPGANAPASYNTHNVCAIKVTRSGGTGKVFLACK